MTMIAVDKHHLIAAFTAAEASLEIISNLPETDLHHELRNLIDTQAEILSMMTDGKHYGSDQLNRFLEYCTNIRFEIARMQESD